MREHAFVMAYPAYVREKARKLRTEKRLTIDELAECLALSRSTIYYWVRDLPIERDPGSPVAREARRVSAHNNREKHRLIRENAYWEGRNTFEHLAKDPTFRDFVNLYVAEGSKRSRNRVAICNSDPALMRLAHRWMRELATNKLKYAVHYHHDQDPDYLQRFWAVAFPGVEPAEIRLQPKSNSGRMNGRNWRSRWGVLTVIANDTHLRMRLEGWIDELRDRWLDSTLTGV
jgi:hypothetical protein